MGKHFQLHSKKHLIVFHAIPQLFQVDPKFAAVFRIAKEQTVQVLLVVLR